MTKIIHYLKTHILDITLIVFVTYLLRLFLVDKNFYIQQQRLFTWLIILLIASLWLKRDAIKVSFEWLVVIGLILLIMFLSVNSSDRYLNSSIKTTLDLSILASCFLIYTNFEDQIARNAKWIMSGMLLIFIVVIAFTTMREMYITIDEDSSILKVKSWGYYYFSHVRHFSYQTFIASAISFILLMTNQKKHVVVRSIFALSFFCSLMCMLLAAGRASILALLVFVFVNAFLQTWKISEAIKSSFILFGLICACYFVLFFTPFDHSVKIVFSHFFNASEVASEGVSSSLNTFTSGRLEIWQGSLKFALESPIFGHGSSSYSWSPLPDAGKLAHSHNVIIQLILEYGYLGASIILYAAYKLFKPLMYFPKMIDDNERLRRMVLSFIVSFSVYSLFTGLFFHTLPIFQFSLMAIVLFALDKVKQVECGK